MQIISTVDTRLKQKGWTAANAGKHAEKMALSDVAVTSVRRSHPFGEPFIIQRSTFTLVWRPWATQNVAWTVASASEKMKLKSDLTLVKFNTEAVQYTVNAVVWCACAKSLQSRSTLRDLMDCSPPGSSIHGDSPGKNKEYWSGLPFPSPGDLFNPGIKPRSPTLQADSLPPKPPGKPRIDLCMCINWIPVLYTCNEHNTVNQLYLSI